MLSPLCCHDERAVGFKTAFEKKFGINSTNYSSIILGSVIFWCHANPKLLLKYLLLLLFFYINIKLYLNNNRYGVLTDEKSFLEFLSTIKILQIDKIPFLTGNYFKIIILLFVFLFKINRCSSYSTSEKLGVYCSRSAKVITSFS